MKELSEFLSKLWRQWVLLVTGGTFTALLIVWDRYRPGTVKLSAYFALLGVFFLVACFRVWREERTRPIGREAHVDASIHLPDVEPQLTASVDWAWIAREIGKPEETQVILMVKLVNAGKPTTVDRWTLAAQSVDGAIEEAVLREISSKFEVDMPDGEHREFSMEDALYEKAFSVPIPAGGMVRGVLWFRLLSAMPEQISSQGCYLVLHASDAFGRHLAAGVNFGPTTNKVPVVLAGLSR